MSKFCVIVVNFRGADLTYKMYKSLIATAPITDKVDFLIVNNSEDHSERARLNEYFYGLDGVVIIESANEGYFAGINYGLRSVELDLYDFVVVGNNDLEFEPEFFEILSKKSYSKNVFAVCPDVLTIDGVHQNPHVRKPYGFLQKMKLDLYYSNFEVAKILRVFKKLIPKKKGHSKVLYPLEIHLGIGAIYVLTRNFFKNNSQLEYPLFLYGEEAFLSNQIHSDGGILLYDPDLIVHHDFSATTSTVQDRVKYAWSQESYRLHRKYL